MTPRAAVGTALLGSALGAGAVPLLRALGTAVPWGVAVLAGLAAALLGTAVLGLAVPEGGPLQPTAPDTSRSASTLGDLSSLHIALEDAARDPDRFESRVRPRLERLVVDRLWLHHDLDWRTESDRAAAAAVLTPGVLALLTAPAGTLRLTPDTLSRWLGELETL